MVLKLKSTWRKKDAYYYQIQVQLNVCDVPYGDFIVWTEAVVFLEQILPKSKFFIKTVANVEKYFVLPELLGKWYTEQPVIFSLIILLILLTTSPWLLLVTNLLWLLLMMTLWVVQHV